MYLLIFLEGRYGILAGKDHGLLFTSASRGTSWDAQLLSAGWEGSEEEPQLQGGGTALLGRASLAWGALAFPLGPWHSPCVCSHWGRCCLSLKPPRWGTGTPHPPVCPSSPWQGQQKLSCSFSSHLLFPQLCSVTISCCALPAEGSSRKKED